MITKQLGSNGSNSASNRIILNSDGSVRWVIKPKPFTRTFAAGEILEVSEKVVPEDTAPEEVEDKLEQHLEAGKCTEEEITTTRALKKMWSKIDKSKTIIQAKKKEAVKEEVVE